MVCHPLRIRGFPIDLVWMLAFLVFTFSRFHFFTFSRLFQVSSNMSLNVPLLHGWMGLSMNALLLGCQTTFQSLSTILFIFIYLCASINLPPSAGLTLFSSPKGRGRGGDNILDRERYYRWCLPLAHLSTTTPSSSHIPLSSLTPHRQVE